jgi:AraC-like DNA-binding protein/mannose-6-phosphate isomerase-like protein (cupin superfamily)
VPQAPHYFAQTPSLQDNEHDPFALQHDPLSDVLELIRVRGNTVFTCAATAPFGIHYSQGRPRLHIIRSGSVTVTVDGIDEIFQASQGDLILLVHANGHIISDTPGREAHALLDIAKRDYDQKRLVLGSGEIVWLCGDFGFDGMLARRLLSVLPPVIVLKGLRDRPFEWLELSCRFILDEALAARSGASAMISRLLDVIFMQVLRTWASNGEVGRGWLSGAIDQRINTAMSAIHANPAHSWTVAELAKLSNLSRSAFAGRFLGVVGQPPMAYLAAWRLDRAAEMLRYGRWPISDVAERVGYTSQAAFSRAFKAQFAMSPLQWRQADV